VKTVEFKYLPDRGNFWAYSPNGKTHELAGTYVLASEANEQDNWNVKKQKELELEQIKDKERIKVLEDALRPMLEVCKDPKSYDLVRVSEIISKALEVKP